MEYQLSVYCRNKGVSLDSGIYNKELKNYHEALAWKRKEVVWLGGFYDEVIWSLICENEIIQSGTN